MSIDALVVFMVRRVVVATGISLVRMLRPAPGLAPNSHPSGFFLLLEQVESLFLLGYLFGYPLIDILDSMKPQELALNTIYNTLGLPHLNS